jgi:DNA-directed RNA polymerase subunit RPC12/RpoP
MFINEQEQQYICHKCVGEEFLKNEIQKVGKKNKCAYCGRKFKTVSLSWLAQKIHIGIDGHFHLTPDHPTGIECAFVSDRESNYEWERHGEPVNSLIQEIAEIEETVANDVQSYLAYHCGGDPRDGEENPYDVEACYEEDSTDDYSFHESWAFFCREIKYNSRFFNQAIEQVLDEIFDGIASFKTFAGKSIVRVAGPNSENPVIFRARVSQTKESLDQILKAPAKELASPPPKNAKHGRMNATGISVFYGATDAETCIAEVRPPVGSHVVVGKFKITRDINILDLNVLSKIYFKVSYFDSESRARLGHAAFLRHLVGELTKPVMPDEEVFEYLPTQIVAEYLAAKVEPRLDGIIFDSSQTQGQGQGQNIILFRNSCGVEPYNLPKGTKISINYGWRTSEDYDDSISVFEELPVKTSQVEQAEDPEDIEQQENHSDCREAILHLDVKRDISVMEIMEASFKKRDRFLSRYSKEKDTEEF